MPDLASCRPYPISTALLLAVVFIGLTIPGDNGAFGQSSTGTTAAQSPAFTAIDLHPTGFASSKALGISGGKQVGWGGGPYTSDVRHALMWSGSATSVVDLHPDGFVTSEAHGISGEQQVGSGVPPGSDVREIPGLGHIQGPFHALLWRGTASSVVDLHPKGFTQSYALGISGVQQVGYGSFGDLANEPANRKHALLWRGSAASVVDLNGGYTSSSVAWGIAGDQQVGSGQMAVPEGRSHALLWQGSAAGVVDLNPSGFFSSEALGVSGDEQVGYGRRDGNCIGPPPTLALVWRGNSGAIATLRDYYLPVAFATFGGEQVGDDGNYPHPHAVLWRGNAESVVDLHAFLPPGFVSSAATGIDANGDIVGYAEVPSDLPYPPTHAILWKRNVKLAPVLPVHKSVAPQDLPAPKPMFISSDDPVSYVLTDPQGRRTGHDSLRNSPYQDIPGAVYRIDTCESSQTTVLEMGNRIPGRYALDVFGGGNFTVYVSTWGVSGHWLTRSFEGTVASGGSSRFTFPGEVATFAAFGATVKISPASDAFEVNSTFTSVPAEEVSPTRQDVTIEVEGHFSATIPAGSFRQIGSVYVFKGVINGVAIKATLAPDGPNRFTFKIGGANATMIEGSKAAPAFWFRGTEATKPDHPVKIELAIGNDAGIVSVNAETSP